MNKPHFQQLGLTSLCPGSFSYHLGLFGLHVVARVLGNEVFLREAPICCPFRWDESDQCVLTSFQISQRGKWPSFNSPTEAFFSWLPSLLWSSLFFADASWVFVLRRLLIFKSLSQDWLLGEFKWRHSQSRLNMLNPTNLNLIVCEESTIQKGRNLAELELLQHNLDVSCSTE